MKNLNSLLFAAPLLALSFVAAETSAQPICIPGTSGCKIEIKPPPIEWTPPPIQGGASGGASLPPVQGSTSPGGYDWGAEFARRARWQAYFEWRVRVAAEAKLSFNARGYIEGLKPQIRLTPDPYVGKPPPVPMPGGPVTRNSALGLLSFCFDIYGGPGRPRFYGYCPTVRHRLNRYVWLAFDMAIGSSIHGSNLTGFGMYAFQPGIQFSIERGKGERLRSRFESIVGADVWLPFADGEPDRAPPVFLGGHVGLGTMLSWDGFLETGFEVRGLLRGGLSGETAEAKEMSILRMGVEFRAILFSFAFW